MALLPITLVGDNLGQRQRHLNALVREAKERGVPIQDVEALPEKSAVDRLFKIDLAIELRHVDYIIRNLKDDDMLYVSRALKSTWLIDHRDIINPKYLEDVLFPEMITPAVTKMKHWLYINLRDPAMCEEFYQHYKENKFEFAVKFLSHCNQEFILTEAPKVLTKLTPHSLKVLCEKCPKVAKIYFDSLMTEEDVKTRYLGQDRSYYNSVKCVLKSDADVFLDITEKYFNMNSFRKLSPLATDYILRHHKTRFTNKLELYVAYFLHIPTLAARLSVEECQEVVIKLARARYLQHWFAYKIVEPLIKRLSPDKRAAFKKRVFVDKDIGDCEDKWPYEIPVPPTITDQGLHIFDDQDYVAYVSPMFPCGSGGGVLFGASATTCALQPEGLSFMNMVPVKTDLDRLFDEFRFIGFERALHELGQRLGATSSTDRRRDIFLVLVSKTGGRTDAVSALLRLASRHRNEPPHTRASILRSLVKRAQVWRLPDDVWQCMLDYGHGLGLDGTEPEAACREGLHAVLIRQLLAGECEQAIRDAFMKDFSTLVEYSLKVDERIRIANGLQNILAAATVDVEPFLAAQRLQQLLDVLKIYRVRVEATSPAVEAIVALAQRDAEIARPLLERLYNEKIARRELLRYNMEFRYDEAALMNALRHDLSLLEFKRVADTFAANIYRRCHPTLFGRAPAQSRNLGISFAQPMGFGTPTPPRVFNFGSSTAQQANAGGSADPLSGSTSGSPAAQPMDIDGGGSSAAPPSFNFGIPAAQLADAGGSATATLGFIFGSPASQSGDVDGSGSSAAPPSFNFGIPTDQLAEAGGTTAATLGFIFGSPASQLDDVDSSSSSASPPVDFNCDILSTQLANAVDSTAPTTGIILDNPAAQSENVDGSGNSSSPPMESNFGVSTVQLPKVDSSDSPTTPTGFNFGIPAGEFSDAGSYAASTRGFIFGNLAAPHTDIGTSLDSITSPTGFNFGIPDSELTVPGGSVAPTTDFIFGTPAVQLTGSSDSSTAPSTEFNFGSPAGQQPVDGDTDQNTDFNHFADQPTVDVSTVHPPAFNNFATERMGFGGSAAGPMGFGSFAPPPFHYRRLRRFSARQPNFDIFTSKLVIYFDQQEDLTTHLRTALKEKFFQEQNYKLARPLATLLGKSFEEELRELDSAGKEKLKFAAALRACAHRARPVVNLAGWGWRKTGVKAVATRAMRCREIERAALTRALAAERRTVKLALVLSFRSPSELFLEIFKSLAELRPAKALSAALSYFRRHGDHADLRVWDIVKPLLSSVNLERRARLRNLLTNIDWIPTIIKADYCVTLYHTLHKISKYMSETLLRDLSKLLPECHDSIGNILLQLLDVDDDDRDKFAIPYPSVFIRYFLLSRNEEEVERRFVHIGNSFIERLDKLRMDHDYQFQRTLREILESLKYNAAFLDTQFSSCLSVIERISAWLQTFMPKEKYFDQYTQIGLTMLYFKAIRQSMEQMPEVFADPKRRKLEGVEAVGFVFGRYIMKEVAELVSTFFDSIIELYTGALGNYLNCNLLYGTSRDKFIGFVLKGILTEAEGIQRRLAVYVLRDYGVSIEDSVRKEIDEIIMKDKSLEILVHADSSIQAVPVIPFHHRFRY